MALDDHSFVLSWKKAVLRRQKPFDYILIIKLDIPLRVLKGLETISRFSAILYK